MRKLKSRKSSCEIGFWETILQDSGNARLALKRVHGSHHIYTHPSYSEILTIPVHGNEDLRKGMQIQLMKSAGLCESDL